MIGSKATPFANDSDVKVVLAAAPPAAACDNAADSVSLIEYANLPAP